MSEITLRIENMHCGSCVRRVTQTLAAVEGVQVQEVRIGAARFTSTQQLPQIDLAVAALAKAGFNAVREE